jgi:hypothetical protein
MVISDEDLFPRSMTLTRHDDLVSDAFSLLPAAEPDGSVANLLFFTADQDGSPEDRPCAFFAAREEEDEDWDDEEDEDEDDWDEEDEDEDEDDWEDEDEDEDEDYDEEEDEDYDEDEDDDEEDEDDWDEEDEEDLR